MVAYMLPAQPEVEDTLARKAEYEVSCVNVLEL